MLGCPEGTKRRTRQLANRLGGCIDRGGCSIKALAEAPQPQFLPLAGFDPGCKHVHRIRLADRMQSPHWAGRATVSAIADSIGCWQDTSKLAMGMTRTTAASSGLGSV